MGPTEVGQTTQELMRGLMAGIEEILPGYAVVLLVAPTGQDETRANYISNARRDDMVAMMKEVAGRLEGRAHDAPATRQ